MAERPTNGLVTLAGGPPQNGAIRLHDLTGGKLEFKREDYD